MNELEGLLDDLVLAFDADFYSPSLRRAVSALVRYRLNNRGQITTGGVPLQKTTCQHCDGGRVGPCRQCEGRGWIWVGHR